MSYFAGTIVIDTREQKPYTFCSVPADVREGGGVVSIRTTSGTLPSGDYSLLGHESEIAVERKSLTDLYGTLSRGRQRFERELARLDVMRFACVVIEAEWSEILGSPPRRSQLPPKLVFRSVLAWQQRFRGVHWLALPSRDHAEVATFRILERYLKEQKTSQPKVKS